MRRLLRRLIVFASVLGMVMVLNVGVAFATHGDGGAAPFVAADDFVVTCNKLSDCPGTSNRDAAALTPGDAPVGSRIIPPTAPGHPAFENQSPQVVTAITHNPNCPLHYSI